MVRMIGAAPARAKMVVVGRGFISITRPPYQTERGGGWSESHLVPKICPGESGSQTDRQTSRQEGGVPHSQPVYLKLPLTLYLFRPCDHFSLSPSSPRRGPASPPSARRHESACNPASNGVSTKLILSNPSGVNPQACGKRSSGEDAGWS